jgi:hypothetical protein
MKCIWYNIVWNAYDIISYEMHMKYSLRTQITWVFWLEYKYEGIYEEFAKMYN